jgi:hypothetical protein
MNEEYKVKAYERTILAEVRRYLIDTFIPYAPDEQKAWLICEDVAHKDRVVPVDALIDVVTLIQEREDLIEREMNKYQFRRNSDGTADNVPRKLDTGVKRSDAGAESGSVGGGSKPQLGKVPRADRKSGSTRTTTGRRSK